MRFGIRLFVFWRFDVDPVPCHPEASGTWVIVETFGPPFLCCLGIQYFECAQALLRLIVCVVEDITCCTVNYPWSPRLYRSYGWALPLLHGVLWGYSPSFYEVWLSFYVHERYEVAPPHFVYFTYVGKVSRVPRALSIFHDFILVNEQDDRTLCDLS